MGYSSRYHTASLVAVFVALAVGVLIGAALGSDVIEGTAQNLEDSLSEDLDQARADLTEAEDQIAEEQALSARLYPAVVDGRLDNMRIALVGLGDLDTSVRDEVADALGPSGGELSEVAAVKLPPDAAKVVDAFRGDDARPVPRSTGLAQASRRIGQILAGRASGLEQAREAALSLYSGSPEGIDAVVVTRSEPSDLSPREEADTATVEDGVLEGLAAAEIPVVGVERTDADPSSIEFFDLRVRASVDNIDELPGHVSLIYTLGGAEGDFGVKETADSLMPDLLVPATSAR